MFFINLKPDPLGLKRSLKKYQLSSNPLIPRCDNKSCSFSIREQINRGEAPESQSLTGILKSNQVLHKVGEISPTSSGDPGDGEVAQPTQPCGYSPSYVVQQKASESIKVEMNFKTIIFVN